MAVTATLKSSKTAIKLNAGQTESGKSITRTVTLPALTGDASNNDIWAIKQAAAPCFAYPVSSVEHSIVTILSEE